MSIYKPCDIRGNVAELGAELYRRWGRVLGSRVEPKSKFVVAGDVRRTTGGYLAALGDGLCQAGASVVDLGVLPTPMVYYARRRLRAAGCAVVTASHNAAAENGLKWMIGDLPPSAEEVHSLRQAVEQRLPRRSSLGSRRELDVSFDYVAWLQETWIEGMEAEMRIVIDPMYGCTAAKARRYLQAVFPRCLFWALHDSPDADFGGHNPDCAQPEHLAELARAVEHERADLGIAFDGDGDRVAFVDDQGVPLTAEEATIVLLESFGGEASGESLVYDLTFSDRLAEAARRLGVEPLRERSGHAHIRRRMLQSKALFGAETSGHYFFRCLEGGDDALFAACWMIAWLAQSRRPLSAQRKACPAVFATPVLRVPLTAAQQQKVMQRVKAVWPKRWRSSLDGLRVEFPDGWGLVRSSVTETGLAFRFESAGWPELQELVWKFCAPLDSLGQQLWSAYAETVSTQCDLRRA